MQPSALRGRIFKNFSSQTAGAGRPRCLTAPGSRRLGATPCGARWELCFCGLRHGSGAGCGDRPRGHLQVHLGAAAAAGRRGAAPHREGHQGGRVPQWVTGSGGGRDSWRGRAARLSARPPPSARPRASRRRRALPSAPQEANKKCGG